MWNVFENQLFVLHALQPDIHIIAHIIADKVRMVNKTVIPINTALITASTLSVTDDIIIADIKVPATPISNKGKLLQMHLCTPVMRAEAHKNAIIMPNAATPNAAYAIAAVDVITVV